MRPHLPHSYAPSAYSANSPHQPLPTSQQSQSNPPQYAMPGQYCSPYTPSPQFPPQYPSQAPAYFYNPPTPYMPYAPVGGYWMPQEQPPLSRNTIVPPPPPIPGIYQAPQQMYSPRPQMHHKIQNQRGYRNNEVKHYQRPRKQERKPITLQNREEIEKWIEARKKNFPTKQNIARKEQLKKKGLSCFPEKLQPVSKLEKVLRKKLTFIMNELESEDRGRFPKRKAKENKRQERKRQEEGSRNQESKERRENRDELSNNKLIGVRKAECQQEAVDLNDELQRDIEEGGFSQTNREIEAKLKKKKRRNNQRGISAVNMSKTSKEMLFTRLVESEKRKEASILLQCFRYLTSQNLI